MAAAKKTAYIIGGYGISGAGYMAYHIALILHKYFDYQCIIVTTNPNNQNPAHGLFQYPILFDTLSAEQMETAVTATDLLISNPANSHRFFGTRLSCRKIMYVQALITFKIFDGFFDQYVCVSHFIQKFLRQYFEIKAPVIPPFTHPEYIPQLKTWEDRPAQKILVMGKDHFAELFTLFKTTMTQHYPHIPFETTVVERYSKSQQEILQLMSEHRYFLQLSPCEGFGLTPLEAMGCGCTVLGFHGFGGLEYMRRGWNCATVAYPQMDSLCDKMAYLLIHPNKAKKLATRGKPLINNYDQVAFEKRWIKFLTRFLN